MVVAMCKLLSVLNTVSRDQVPWQPGRQPATLPNEAAEQWLAG